MTPIKQENTRESLATVVSYWIPELISFWLLVVLPLTLDSYLIGSLKSTAIYGVFGSVSRVFHFILKIAEAIPVATIAIIGRYNGAGQHEVCGKRLTDAVWTSLVSGSIFFFIFFFGARQVYQFIGVPDELIHYGITFLRVQACNVPLIFLFSVLMGFLKALKNTRTPLAINVIGITLFIAADSILIHGMGSLPALGFTGSALATLLRYAVMNLCAIWYLSRMPKMRSYFPSGFSLAFNLPQIKKLLSLSGPVIIDKGTLAFALMWLGKMIASSGVLGIAAIEAIKNIERYSLLPALAFAQVLTFLVSNRLGANDPEGAKINIRRVIIMAAPLTIAASLFFKAWGPFLANQVDPSGTLATFMAPLLIPVPFFLFFDFLQILLASALRGAGDVRAVMITRSLAVLVFIPLSWAITKIEITNLALKFSMIYASYYLIVALMALAFLLRLRGNAWQRVTL
jgi:putative MATE family efflux protein